jgi:acyl-CoA reductase-like NAD-dependent aldehyde dehydrogenase
MGEKSLLNVHEPLGVAALIAPWNFPIGMPARKVRFLTSHVGEKSLLTVHEPLGVAALIAP